MGPHTRAAAAALLSTLAVLLASCSSGPAPAPSTTPSTAPSGTPAPAPTPASPPLPPAGPADSPVPPVAPAGSVVPVGAGAEGVAVDPATNTVAVGTRAPDTLVLVDAASGQVRARTPLPGHLRHLVVDGPGTLLVPDEDANALLTVALPAGNVVASLPTGTSPHYALREPDGTLLVADEAGHEVAVVRDGRVVGGLTDAVMPGGMAVAGGRLGLVDVASDTLTLYDAAGLGRLAQVPLGAGPTHEVSDGRGDLVVVDTRGQALLFTTPSVPPTVRLRLPLPGTPYGIAADPVHDRVWVTLTASDEVVGFDVHADPPREIARFPTVRQPNTVAVDPGSGRLFVTGAADGVLQTIAGPR